MIEGIFQPLFFLVNLKISLRIAMNNKSRNGAVTGPYNVYKYNSDKYINQKELSNIYFNVKENIVLENIDSKERIFLTYLEYVLFKLHLDTVYAWIATNELASKIWLNDNTLNMEYISGNKKKYLLEIRNGYGQCLSLMPSTIVDETSKRLRGIEFRFDRGTNFIFLTERELLLLKEGLRLIDIKSCSFSLASMFFNNQELFQREIEIPSGVGDEVAKNRWENRGKKRGRMSFNDEEGN